MSKEVIAVYQDCFLCGSSDEKGKKMLEAIAKKGYEFRKVSFATVEGNTHCLKAVENGITTMPFFTDGKIYSSDYKDVIQAQSEPQTIKVKATTQAKKKGKKHGAVQES